ncbi:hypothetical protein [Rhodococcus sp. 14-2470-1a]|uniref:hypothetical protein n=1 Tax=Rhodococcus sp. 14-2470-1a TaxID=2023150 RepID=UPI00117AB42D|nr:hypothetical protein [Rhodococcus sp. 14-2470-1a]
MDTDPRAVLCVERLEEGDTGGDPVVLGERWMASNLPAVPQIETQTQAMFPVEAGPIPVRDADRLLYEIFMADAELACDRSALVHGELAEPYVRLNAVSICLLCDVEVQPGDPETGVHVARRDLPSQDVDGLLCVECSTEMSTRPYETLVEHRMATRHPQCPRCASFKTLYVAHGKLQLPPEFAPRWPWEIPTGDAFDGSETQWSCSACAYGWDYLFADLAPSQRPIEVAPLWERNLDNRIVLARKRKNSDRFEPMSVLCAPLEPTDVMRILSEIVDTTFAGNWPAALNVILDESVSAWEFLDCAVNEHSESIGDRARDVVYSGNPKFIAVPGVGIKTDYGPYEHGETGVGEASYDFYDVMYAFLIDGDGNADILTAQTQYEVVENGRTLTGDDETWSFSYTLVPADYRR